MFSGKEITLLDALNVSIISMTVVFVVLFILFTAVKLFPVIFKEKKVAKEEAPAAEENSEELLVLVTAAVHAYEGEELNTGTSLARNYKH